jgi:hypothetical protein
MTYEEKLALYNEKLAYEVCPIRIRQLEAAKFALFYEETKRLDALLSEALGEER